MEATPVETRPGPQLSDTALTMLRGALMAQRQEAELRATQGDLPVGDREEAYLGLTSEAVARARELIELCDEALERMAKDTFGRCEVCGEDIPVERLEAVPYTRTCVRCPAEVRGLLR